MERVLSTAATVAVLTVALALLVACQDSPTHPPAQDGRMESSPASFSRGGPPSGRPPSGLRVYWAQVDIEGNLLGGNVVSVTRMGNVAVPNLGVYRVEFPEAVTGCAISATPSKFQDDDGSLQTIVGLLLRPLGRDDVIQLETWRPGGTLPERRPFHVTALCVD